MLTIKIQSRTRMEICEDTLQVDDHPFDFAHSAGFVWKGIGEVCSPQIVQTSAFIRCRLQKELESELLPVLEQCVLCHFEPGHIVSMAMCKMISPLSHVYEFAVKHPACRRPVSWKLITSSTCSCCTRMIITLIRLVTVRVFLSSNGFTQSSARL